MGKLVTIEESDLEELKQVRHQYQALLDTSPNAIIHAKLDGEIYRFNKTAQKVFKIEQSEALGKHLSSFCPFSDLENEHELLARADTTGTEAEVVSKAFETERLLPDGTVIVLDINLTLERDTHGKPFGWCAIMHDISARIESKRKIQDSNNKMRSIFRAAPIGIGVTVNRILTDVNETFCSILGFTREEVIGREARFLYPTEDEYRLVGQVKYELIKEHGTGTIETQMVAKDGHIVDVIMSSTPLEQEDWSKGVTFTILDITDRKKAEQKLRSSEEYFRTLMEQLPIGVAIYNKSGTLERMNRTFLRNWHLPEEVYDRIEGRFNILQSEQVMNLGFGQLIERAFNGEVVHVPPVPSNPEPYLPGFDFKSEPQEHGWLITHFYPLHDEKGEVERIISVHEDVTDHIVAEERLASRAKTLDAIFNATPSILMLVDEECRVEKINQQGATFSGQEIRDLYGCYGGEVLNCSSFHRLNECRVNTTCRTCPLRTKVAETFATGLPHEKELGRMAFYEGEENRFHDILISTALIDIDGNNRVLLSITDVTSVRQKELELRKEKEERHKIEQQFRQSQKMESIGRLAGGVAHDLNNLLSPILGYGEILVEDLAEADPRRSSAQHIVNAGLRAGELVRQLLAFSRKQKLDYKAIDINRLYSNFTPLIRRTIREDIEIKDNLAEQLPVVQGDIGQLEQVILNLCINAQDAMPEGGTLYFETKIVALDELRTSLYGDIEPGRYVQILVTDTGSGMDETTLSKIFEPFFTTKEKHKGTGLGLAMAYGIVSQHGGTIWCVSEVGQGTTFEVYLPVSTDVVEVVTAAADAHEIESGAGESILLVEDNEQLRGMAEAVLSRHGYDVVSAADGREALELCHSATKPFKLLLTDIVMPEINGRELAEKVFTLYPDIKVLYMSGYPDDILALQGKLKRELPYMQKPFTVQGLLRNVQDAL